MPTVMKMWNIKIKAQVFGWYQPRVFEGQYDERASAVHVATARALTQFKQTIPKMTRIKSWEIEIEDLGSDRRRL